MMLDMLAAISRQNYEDRRLHQYEEISRAKADEKFRASVANHEKHKLFRTLRQSQGLNWTTGQRVLSNGHTRL